MSIKQICQRAADVALVEESAWQAAERMHQHTVGTLVVVNGHRTPIGILTDRDLVVRVLAPGKDPYATLVGEVLTAHPRTISENSPLDAALTMMRNGGFRRLPVVDAQGALVGLVSLDDILLHLVEQFSRVGKLLEAQTPGAVQAT